MEHDKYAIYIVSLVAIVGMISLVVMVMAPGTGDLAGQAYYGGYGGLGGLYVPTYGISDPGFGIFQSSDMDPEEQCEAVCKKSCYDDGKKRCDSYTYDSGTGKCTYTCKE